MLSFFIDINKNKRIVIYINKGDINEMTDKAYIVANKQQELDVLNKFERKGFKWGSEELPTEFIFSDSVWFDGFPYVITENKDVWYIGWTYDSQYFNDNVVYDGRKEEKMCKVS